LRKLFSLAVALFSALIVKNNYLINLLLFIYNNFRKFGGKILPTLNVAKKQYHTEKPTKPRNQSNFPTQLGDVNKRYDTLNCPVIFTPSPEILKSTTYAEERKPQFAKKISDPADYYVTSIFSHVFNVFKLGVVINPNDPNDDMIFRSFLDMQTANKITDEVMLTYFKDKDFIKQLIQYEVM
jgi:hypothetical protein